MSGSILYASKLGDARLQFQKGAVAAANESGSRAFIVFSDCVRTRSGSDGIISSTSLSEPVATAPGSDTEKQQMRKSTKRLLGGLAVGAAAVGTIGAVLMKTRSGSGRKRRRELAALENTWARPGMKVIFRAEVMPGRETSERTFRVDTLLPSGRVLLEGASGEHAEKEFERIRR